jgi:predicted nucleotidyltransferase
MVSIEMKESIVLKENEKRAITMLKKILSEKYNIIELRLFGSKACGESTPESDMDVMIKIDECNSGIRSQIYDIIFEINLENDTFISTTIFGKKEIEDGPMAESPIYKIIHKEGFLI